MQIKDLENEETLTEDKMSLVKGAAVAVWPLITDKVRKANHVYNIVTDAVRNAGIRIA